jgi:hypothetical protein
MRAEPLTHACTTSAFRVKRDFMMATDSEVAAWMFEELQRRRRLEQQYAVSTIATVFGKEFTYRNKEGKLAISKAVLNSFKNLCGDHAVWELGERAWLLRKNGGTG